MKKVLSTLLAVCLVFTAIPCFSASAKSVNLLSDGDFSGYELGKLSNSFNETDWFGSGGTIAEDPLDSNNKGCIVGYNVLHALPTLQSNTSYQIDFDYIRAASATGNGINLRIQILEGADSSKVAVDKITVNSEGYNREYIGCSATTWNSKSYTFKTGDLKQGVTYSIYFTAVGNNMDGIFLMDNVSVTEVIEPVNSGLIMDGDFEATEKLDTYKYNNGISSTLDTGKWYSSPTGKVTVENDAEHGNYISLSNQGRIAQKLPNVKQNDGVVITFKAKWNAKLGNDQFWFYVTPASVAHAYAYRGYVSLTTDWQEYTIIYNPEGGKNGSSLSEQQITLGSGTVDSTEDFVFLLYAGSNNNVSIDDVRVDSLDPFASNDLGDAQLTGVSMRGQSGTLPTAIRWKNAIRKNFVANGIGDWKVTEYGALVAGTEKLAGSNLTVETENTLTGVAFQQSSNTLKLFDETDEHNIFSLALSGIQAENYGKELTVRPYAKISNGQKTITVYGEARSNSLFDACHAVLSGSNESDIAVVKGILTAEEEIKTAYLAKFADDAAKLN